MLPSETMIWQPEFTDKTLSRKTGAVQLMANAGTGEPLLTLVCSGSWPLDQTLARDTRP